MRICCVLAGLSAGGAERVMTTMCESWATEGRDVTLITLSDGATEFFAVPAGVTHIALALSGSSASPVEAVARNWRRVRALRRTLRRIAPDVVIAFADSVNVLTLLATRGLGVPVLISERTHPPSHSIGRPWRWLRRVTYPLADALVVQTERTRVWANSIVRAEHVHVIPNPLAQRFAQASNDPASRETTIAAMGRLSSEKHLDLLITAFGRIVSHHPGWRLEIIGDGPLRPELERLAARLLPADRFAFRGMIDAPDRALRRAGIFVLSSRFEGYPNALIEAMACGCPVIATDCPTGPAEIISANVDGLLIPVDDADALATTIERLILSPAERVRLGCAAQDVRRRFLVDGVMEQWDRAIVSAIAGVSR